MGVPHKHAELIKAWADGATIEFRGGLGEWHVTYHPDWFDDVDYRIKPEPKKVIFYLYTNGNHYEVWETAPKDGHFPTNFYWKYIKTFEYTEGEES